MGFIDSIKEAFAGERDQPSDEATPRHIDREAREEASYGPPVAGGKHAARD